MAGLPQTNRGYSETEHQFDFSPAASQRRVGNGYAQGTQQAQFIGNPFDSLTKDELSEMATYREVIESGGTLSCDDEKKYNALRAKVKCWPGLGMKVMNFDYIQSQLSPAAGGWCAFISSLLACMFLALVCGWTVAAMQESGDGQFNKFVGPTVWGIATGIVLMIGTFSMCPPELNFWTHIAKFAFDKNRWANLGFHVGHILGGLAGFFIGYAIVWAIFEGYPTAYEQAVAFVHSPYNVGRALATEAIFTYILVLGTLALTIVVPYWATHANSRKGLGRQASRLMCCIAEGFLVFACSFAAWNVTGAGLNLFRWLTAAVMNSGYNYEVASTWYIYPLGQLAGCFGACVTFWAFWSLTGFKLGSTKEN